MFFASKGSISQSFIPIARNTYGPYSLTLSAGGSTQINATEFHHLAAVYNRDTGGKDLMQLYIDGVLVDDNDASTVVVTFWVGGRPNGASMRPITSAAPAPSSGAVLTFTHTMTPSPVPANETSVLSVPPVLEVWEVLLLQQHSALPA